MSTAALLLEIVNFPLTIASFCTTSTGLLTAIIVLSCIEILCQCVALWIKVKRNCSVRPVGTAGLIGGIGQCVIIFVGLAEMIITQTERPFMDCVLISAEGNVEDEL